MRTSILPSSSALCVGILLFCGVIHGPGLQAAMPETLNYQGRMRLTSGAAVADSNTNTIEFRIYDASTAGTLLWSETQSGVTTTAGLFNAQLGTVNPLSALNFNQPYWLTLVFNGDASEMSPRTPFTAGPYAFRAKFADQITIPFNANGADPGAILSGFNSDSIGVGVQGDVSAGFANSTGVLGQGGRGVVGTSNAVGGVGVLAQQGSGSNALAVSGNARYDWGTTSFLAGTSVDFNPGSNVDFTGASVTGLPMGVVLPAFWATPTAGAVLSLSNTGLGMGLLAEGPTAIAAHGVQYGLSVTASGPAAMGVIATVNSSNYAMRAINNGNGFGVLGTGLTGVAGIAPNAASLGVFASSNGIAGAVALKVSGPAEFGGGQVSFKDQVSFVGATVTGLPVTAPPVNWTLSHGAPLLTVSATGAGRAIYAYAQNEVAVVGESPNAAGLAGVGVAGYGVYAQSNTNAAVFASSTAGSTNGVIEAQAYGLGAALLARGNAVAVSATVKESGATAVYGYSDFNGPGTTYGVRGISRSQAGFGVHGENQTPSGIGVFGMGGIGVLGEPSFGTGTGVAARQGVGTWALSVSGAARFQYGPVDFSGATVTGLALGVPNPLVLANNLTGPVLSVSNTGSGPAIVAESAGGGAFAISATAMGTVVYGNNISGGGFIPAALFHSDGTNHAVQGRNLSSGSLGILAGDETNSSSGVYGRAADSWGVGVHGESATHQGVRGSGLVGVAGVVTATGQTALLADTAGFSPSRALHSIGDSLFELGRVSFTGQVDFSSATVTGLALGVVAPLSLSSPSSATTIYAFNGSSGEAIRGRGLQGVVGEADAAGGIGVLAINPFAAGTGLLAFGGPGGTAIRLTGSARLDAAPGLTITVGSYVSFTAGTNIGSGVPNPLFLSNTAGVPVLDVVQNASADAIRGSNMSGLGYGVAAIGSGSGGGLYAMAVSPAGKAIVAEGVGTAISASSQAGSALVVRNNSAGSATLQALNDATPGTAIRGQSNGNGTAAIQGLNLSFGGVGMRAEGGGSGGVGLVAEAGVGGTALRVSGSGVVDAAPGLSITVASFVSFTAGTNLSTAITAPLNLSATSVATTIYGFNGFGGEAIRGRGLQGVVGEADAAGGIGVLAINPFAAGTGLLAFGGPGGTAIRLTGSARLDAAPGLTITVGSYVSFTAGTNLAGASGPLSVTASIAHPGGVFNAINTGSGNGISGYATQPGWGASNSTITAGVYGYSGVSLSVGVLGVNEWNSMEAAGMYAKGPIGIIAESWFNDGMGGDFKANSGTGVQARGLTGVAAKGGSGGSLALLAKGHSLSERAIQADGRVLVLADSKEAALSVTQSSSAYGSAGIVAYSAASGSAAIRGVNTNSSAPSEADIPGIGLWGEGMVGVVAMTNQPGGMGLYAESGSLSTSAAIRAEHKGSGTAVEVEANSGTAYYARGVTGVAAFSYSPQGVGIFVYGTPTGKALVVDGPSRFNNWGSNNLTQFNGFVDFSGATVTGLAGGGGGLPVQGSAFAAYPSAPVHVTNTGSGFGIVGVATQAGNHSGPMTIGASLTAGVEGRTGVSLSAGVIGRNTSFSQETAGVIGLSNGGSGVYGVSFGNGQSGGSFEANNGRGITARGLTGLAAEASFPGALALHVYATTGAKAMEVYGDSQFNFSGATSTTKFNGYVDFSGATVSGISASVPNPLVLSNNIASPIIEAQNNMSGAVAIKGSNTSGGSSEIGVMGQVSATGANSPAGVLGVIGFTTSTPFGGAGVVGNGGDYGHGVYASSQNAGYAAVYAQALSSGAGATGVLGTAVSAGPDAVIGVMGSLQNLPVSPMPTTSTAIYGHGAFNGFGVFGSAGSNSYAGVYGRHNNAGVGGIGVLGEAAPSSTGVGVVGAKQYDFNKNSIWATTGSNGGGVYGMSRNWGEFGVAGYASDDAKVGVLAIHDAGGPGLIARGKTLGAEIGASLTSTGQVTGLVVSATTQTSFNGVAVGLSVAADFTSSGGQTAVGAVIKARGEWETVGLSVTAESQGPGDRPGYGIQVYSNRTGIRAVALDASANSPAGIAIIGEGGRVGVHGLATRTAAGPMFTGVGMLAESTFVALSAVARDDFTGNSGVAIYAAGRRGAMIRADTWDNFAPVYGVDLGVINQDGSSAQGAVGLSATVRSMAGNGPAVGVSVTAKGGYNGGMNLSTIGGLFTADSPGNLAYGVRGVVGPAQAGAGIRGETGKLGGFATSDAGVQAVNTGFSNPGNPAIALDIDGGIQVNSTRGDRAAGSVNINLGAGYGIRPCMQSGSQPFGNNQITNGSLILLTPVYNGAIQVPVTARISAQSDGNATIEVHAVGQDNICPGLGNVTVNYLIINTR